MITEEAIFIGGPDDGGKCIGSGLGDTIKGPPHLIGDEWRWAIYKRAKNGRFEFTGEIQKEKAKRVDKGEDDELHECV